jgi:hypothetical protein
MWIETAFKELDAGYYCCLQCSGTKSIAMRLLTYENPHHIPPTLLVITDTI